MTMKKWLTGILTLVMLVSIPVFSSAMSNKELAEERQQMRENLDRTPTVTYYDLKEDPDAYKGQILKFYGKVVGIWDPSILFQDGDGNVLVITVPVHYKLKLGQDYEIGGTFSKMMNLNIEGESKLCAVFTYEDSHLPYFTEYSDYYR